MLFVNTEPRVGIKEEPVSECLIQENSESDVHLLQGRSLSQTFFFGISFFLVSCSKDLDGCGRAFCSTTLEGRDRATSGFLVYRAW